MGVAYSQQDGPPQEPPFVEDPEFEDLGEPPAPDTSLTQPAEAPTLEKENPSFQQPAIVEAPPVQKRLEPTYSVPKSPQTAEGKRYGKERINHPLAAKGLLKIDKDGSYYYKPQKFKSLNYTVNLRAGQITPPPEILGPGGYTDFRTMYTNRPMQFIGEYESYFSNSPTGRLGYQAGLGVFQSRGNGRFADCSGSDDECQAREVYTFYGLPVYAGVIYRMQYSDSAWFAPYFAGGGAYYLLAEKRDDNKPLKAVGTAAFYGSAGILLNISVINKDTAFTLVSEYGLHNVWGALEYRYVKSARRDLDISAGIINGGLILDY